jgi:hypothetical protein
MVALSGTGSISQASAKVAPNISALKLFLRSEQVAGAKDPLARFWSSRPPGTTVTLVYLQSSGNCGTGGCTLMILQPKGTSFHVEKSFPAALRPVTLLPEQHFGRPDIGIRCRCEPTKDGWAFYQIPLRFDGRRYQRLLKLHLSAEGRPLKGRVLIGKNEPGIRLY